MVRLQPNPRAITRTASSAIFVHMQVKKNLLSHPFRKKGGREEATSFDFRFPPALPLLDWVNRQESIPPRCLAVAEGGKEASLSCFFASHGRGFSLRTLVGKGGKKKTSSSSVLDIEVVSAGLSTPRKRVKSLSFPPDTKRKHSK